MKQFINLLRYVILFTAIPAFFLLSMSTSAMLDNKNEIIAATERDPFQKNNIYFTSGKLSMDIKNMPLRNLLGKIAQYNHSNIVIDKSVTGNISLNLSKVTCKQALDIISKMQGLKQYRHDKTLFIAANDQSLESLDNDLHAELFKLHHIRVQSAHTLFANKGAGLLSKNAGIIIDAPTNTILIKDTSERLRAIQRYLKQIDVPSKQIIIRARIVSINNNFTKELGLRYFTKVRTPLSDGIGLTMDMPEVPLNLGKFGFALATFNKNNLLDLELSALENEGHGKIISSPELITSNQHAAYIEAGENIPYQVKNSRGGATILFKKAVLSLQVIPEIVPDNKIILHLIVNHDKANTTLFNGVPSIQTRAIRTEVLVNNAETIVLGGIYEEVNNSNFDKVPFLSRLPILGGLFRAKIKQMSNSQLLIFVTPEIVD